MKLLGFLILGFFVGCTAGRMWNAEELIDAKWKGTQYDKIIKEETFTNAHAVQFCEDVKEKATEKLRERIKTCEANNERVKGLIASAKKKLTPDEAKLLGRIEKGYWSTVDPRLGLRLEDCEALVRWNRGVTYECNFYFQRVLQGKYL